MIEITGRPVQPNFHLANQNSHLACPAGQHKTIAHFPLGFHRPAAAEITDKKNNRRQSYLSDSKYLLYGLLERKNPGQPKFQLGILNSHFGRPAGQVCVFNKVLSLLKYSFYERLLTKPFRNI